MSSRESKPNSRIAELAYKYVPAALAALHEIIISKSASDSARVSASHIMLTYASTASGYQDLDRLTNDEVDVLYELVKKAHTDDFPTQ